jgi:hypothetical protein
MARRNLTHILALLFLIVQVFCPVLSSMWLCEGRVCATGFVGCCCSAPGNPGRDGSCDSRSSSRAGGSRATLECGDGCGCVQIVSECSDHEDAIPVSGILSLAIPLVALPPTQPHLYIAPLLTDEVSRYTDTRGPPGLRSVAFSSFGLRAPPAA